MSLMVGEHPALMTVVLVQGSVADLVVPSGLSSTAPAIELSADRAATTAAVTHALAAELGEWVVHLTVAQVAALKDLHYARLKADGVVLAAGQVQHNRGWDGRSRSRVSTSITFGPGAAALVASAQSAASDAANAALDAQSAAADAQAAAGLVGAPAGAAVDTAIGVGGAARATLEASFADRVRVTERPELITRHGVTRGTAATQTAAIKTALDANPGRAFVFPGGDYRLDTTLVVSASNSLILDPGARIYAGATMAVLIDYDNGAGVSGYAADKAITGAGLLDGALKAGTVLRLARVLRLTLSELTVKDGINRGIVAQSAGAEIIGKDIRVYNSGTTNVADNIGVDCLMSDCQWSDVIIRDCTIGIRDSSGSTWTNAHPWLGDATQLAARYPDSVGFLLKGSSALVMPVADTYRYAFRTAADSGYARARISGGRDYRNPGNLSTALAQANPGSTLDLVDGGSVIFRDGLINGLAAAPHPFVTGATTRLNARGNIGASGVTGLVEYHRGVPMGRTSFTPTVFGSTVAGTQTYGTRSGYMEVRDGVVRFHFQVTVTLGADITGNLRIGLAYPTGATSVSNGQGPAIYGSGVALTGFIGGSGTASPLAAIAVNRGASTSTEVPAAPLAGTQIQVWGSIECPFDYPTT